MPIGSVAQGKINAEIILRLEKLQAGATKAATITKKMSADIASSSKASAKAMSAAWAAGFAIISVIALKMARKVTAAFKDMVGTYAEFEQSLANTQSVARASAEELDKMEAAARRVGATTRSTASQAANALYYLASAGFTATEAIAALDGVNALAIATQSDLAKTSETVAVTIRQYGLETSAATDIANTFTAAITSSLATMNKLAKSFEYVGPLAAGLGLTVEETTGALQLLYNKGFSGEKAGRGLRSILADLADSTSVVNRKLGELGISFGEVNPATNKFADIMDTLREKGVNAGNAVAFFGKVSGVQLGSFVSLASDAKGGMIELTEAVTGTNRAFEAMEIQMDTLKGSFDKFKNAEEALKISIGKELSPTLRSLVDTFTGLLLKVNSLPAPFLAATTIFATIIALVTTLTVAITALKLALASAIVAPVIAALISIAAPMIILATSIAGIVAGMAVLNKIKLDDSKKQFSGMAKEMGATELEVEKVSVALKHVDEDFSQLSKSGAISAIQFKRVVADLANKLGLTEEQILKVAEANEEFMATSGDLVIALRIQIDKVNDLAEAEEKRWAAVYAMTQFEKDARSQALKDFQEAKKRAKLLEEQEGILKSLETAFERAEEKQKLLGDSYNRSTELSGIFEQGLIKLINNGIKKGDEAMDLYIAKYKELQDAMGVVGDGLTDWEVQVEVNKMIVDGFKDVEDAQIRAKLAGKEYNVMQERRRVLLEAIAFAQKYNFTIEGGFLSRLIATYPKLLSLKDVEFDKTKEYNDKLKRLLSTKVEIIELDRKAAIIEAKKHNASNATLNAMTKYYDELRKQELESQYSALDLSDKLKELTATEQELLVAERNRAIESVLASDLGAIAMSDLIRVVNELYNSLEEETAFDTFVDNFETVVDAIGDFTNAIDDFIQTSIQNQIDAEERLLQTRLDALDTAEEAELVSAGVQEKTALELAQEKIDAAIAAGDIIAQQEAQDAYDRLAIQQDYDAQRIVLEDAANRKIAELQYKADMVAWAANSLTAITQSTLAILSAYAQAPLGFKTMAAGIAGAVTALQLMTIAASKPQPPTFADGGIVPGSSYRGDSTDILANAGELILNQAQQEVVADKLGYDDRPIIINTKLVLDGKVIAISSAKYYRGGQVKL